jgi:hypothetical protein
LKEENIPDYMKNIIDNKYNTEIEQNVFLNFNSSKSLAARLYHKNKNLMDRVYKSEDKKQRDSLLSLLDNQN